jgi:3-keto-5-aminohexanoate cleavage enzyme
MSWTTEPVIITVAPTGAEVSREQNPRLPITPEEIARDVAACAREGASAVHIHARTPDGRPTTDPDVLRRIARLIRDECDIVIGMSTGAQVGMSHEERIRVLDASPEVSSLNCGSLNFGDEIFDNDPALIEALAKRMRADGVRPELEIYDLGMLATAGRLLDGGLLADPPLYNFVMGVRGGIRATTENLIAMLRNMPRPGHWTATGIGRDQLPLTTVACVMGGHMRVGFEDNVYYRRGQLASSNAELVARARRLAEELSRPVATPTQAREILGVNGG